MRRKRVEREKKRPWSVKRTDNHSGLVVLARNAPEAIRRAQRYGFIGMAPVRAKPFI